MLAVLISRISLKDADQNLITIPCGTEIIIDVSSDVGYFNGVHFHIDSDEYVLPNSVKHYTHVNNLWH